MKNSETEKKREKEKKNQKATYVSMNELRQMINTKKENTVIIVEL